MLKFDLCARNQENLQQTKLACENLKANVQIKILDVRDSLACKKWINEIEQNYTIDLIIANAGISAGTSKGTESFEQVNEIFATNLNGVCPSPSWNVIGNNTDGSQISTYGTFSYRIFKDLNDNYEYLKNT